MSRAFIRQMKRIYNIISLDRIEDNINMVSRNSFGVFICTAGRARVSIGDKMYDIDRDTLFIYAPYTVIRIDERTDDWDGMLIEEEVNILFTIISDASFVRPLTIREHPCIRLTASQRDDLMTLIRVIDRRDELFARCEGTDGETLRREALLSMVRALCMELMAVYFECTPVDELPRNRESKVFNRFMMSAFDKCMTQRNVAFYAAEQNLSPGHFSVIVRKASGHTPLKWIETVTMAKARKMLTGSTLSIKEIASMMNFPDQSTFGKYFRNRQGMSPSEYRQQH